ncbi:MAG: restriction endonuclease [Deltaproteobacteria bacterium]|uniref:Restriction endonuclease n=1 Tax=Candidatus Desulfacyla euxinica TaxID=2841693 RepID=A0A8J6N355_9DELT|nr:restriction endonuclease [Candidatus Desulfacyla euxinica]MBL7218399.1 restriction endonuclease [Desulfobacteraceae bacterium]
MTQDDNILYYGDNLPIMREEIPSQSVDLVYLDPPFNSNRNYNVLYQDEGGLDSEAQITAFEDTWHWDMKAEETYQELIMDAPSQISDMIGAFRGFIGTNQMMAYLVMMTIRLIELHRILKDTGSLYLHCDPTASHYLKMLLDTIFGGDQFRNEIIWKRTSAHSDTKQGVIHMGRIHDTILFYTKSNNVKRNEVYLPYDQTYIDRFYRYVDEDGRKYRLGDLTGPGGASKGNPSYEFMGVTRYWRYSRESMEELSKQGRIIQTKPGRVPAYKRYLDEMPGVPLQDMWTDLTPIGAQAKERLGYPTQKPVSLLERIIKASSKKGDVVLDPFCGCGTAIHTAQKLKRKWIGIDVTHLAIALLKYRLKDGFDIEAEKDYKIHGEPQDLAGAVQLAQDHRFQFQWWALSLIQAKPFGGQEGSKKGKKGKDRGIDGIINFIDDKKGKAKRVIVQVKSGKVKSGDIRDLKGTIEREKAEIGVFITLQNPTKDMNTEAASSGFYRSEEWHTQYPKLQILTIENLLNGMTVSMPPIKQTFKKAAKEMKWKEKQRVLFDKG